MGESIDKEDDAKNGKRVWFFQTVHHGLWDYDIPAAPVLGTVTVAGRSRDIVAVPTKTGFLFVFDRVTGAPICHTTPEQARVNLETTVAIERSVATGQSVRLPLET